MQENLFDSSETIKPIISQDGKTFFVLNSDQIVSYEAATLQKVDDFRTSEFKYIGISPDGKIAVLQLNDSEIALWDLTANKQKIVIEIPNYHQEELDLAFSPTGEELAANWGYCDTGGKNVAVWDTGTGKLLWHKVHGFCAGDGLAYSPDGKTIASGVAYSRTLLLFDANNGEVEEIYSQKQPEWVSSVTFSPTGKILAFGTGHTGEGILLAPVIILDTSSGSMLHMFDGKRDTVNSLSISPNDEVIVAGTGDGAVVVWNIKAGNHLCTLNLGKGKIEVFFTRNNSFVSVQEDGILNLWEIGK